VNFTLYLGRPRHAGDIESVVVIGSDTALHLTAKGGARVFKDSAGGLELLFDQFPTLQGAPTGITATLNSVSLTAGAKRTVFKRGKKVTYSLLTNPSTCKGMWTGTAIVTFPNQSPSSFPFSAACRS
jgi:hypothetical protein